MAYFETKKSPRVKRWMGCTGAYKMEDTTPMIGVWNRFVDRWNEVENDRNLPLILQDRTFHGASVFSTGTCNHSEIISSEEFDAEIYFRKDFDRFCPGFSTARVKVTNPNQITEVWVHYRDLQCRDLFNQWLAAEYTRFHDGINSYDSVIALKEVSA